MANKTLFSSVYEVLLKDEIQHILKKRYIDDLFFMNLFRSREYDHDDYHSSDDDIHNVVVELKAFRVGSFCNKYDSINTITPREREHWEETFTHVHARSFVFVFIYFYEDNTMYFARINEKDIDEMVYEEWRNRYCLKKSLFQQVQLRRDYRLLNVL